MALTLGQRARRTKASAAGAGLRCALARRPWRLVSILALVLGSTALWLVAPEGQLTVTSEPAGAMVYLDGRRVGPTPLVVSTRLFERSGQVEVRASGAASAAHRFTIRPGQRETLHVLLAPRSSAVASDSTVEHPEATQRSARVGRIRIESTPPGATVWLDGGERGRTPLALDDLPTGRHELRLTAPRYEPHTQEVVVEVDRLTTVAVKLQPVTLPEGFAPRPGLPPVAVIIENHPESWPQTGLDHADVIYEALVEGGVTRFLAIYSTDDAPVVGPVRSMRDYFVYWASEYKPILAHIGGSPQSYGAVTATGLRHFEETPRYGFWRSADRYAPHNAYLNTAAVRRAAQQLGMLGDGAFSALVQKPDWPLPLPEAARSVALTYPGGYRVDYAYDPGTRHYLRLMAGRPHKDAASGAQLAARALVVQRVATRSIDEMDRQRMDLVGQGKIAYFVDGRVGVGTWRKTSPAAPTIYFDAAGERLVLPPGQVWIQVLPPGAPLEWGE